MLKRFLLAWTLNRRGYIGRHRFSRHAAVQQIDMDTLLGDQERDATLFTGGETTIETHARTNSRWGRGEAAAGAFGRRLSAVRRW